MRRIAVSRLHLPDGTILSNQVLEFQDNSLNPLVFYNLKEELPYTEWISGDYYLPLTEI